MKKKERMIDRMMSLQWQIDRYNQRLNELIKQKKDEEKLGNKNQRQNH